MNRVIRETDDYNKLVLLYEDNDLEIEIGEPPHGEIIKNFECVDENGRLLAGATLLNKSGICVLEYLAVAKDLHKSGIGKEMMQVILSALKDRREKELWLCAKVPEYYLKFGFDYVDDQDAPRISLCQSCENYLNGCYPKIMRKFLE